jgi:hypothetical protein
MKKKNTEYDFDTKILWRDPESKNTRRKSKSFSNVFLLFGWNFFLFSVLIEKYDTEKTTNKWILLCHIYFLVYRFLINLFCCSAQIENLFAELLFELNWFVNSCTHQILYFITLYCIVDYDELVLIEFIKLVYIHSIQIQSRITKKCELYFFSHMISMVLPLLISYFPQENGRKKKREIQVPLIKNHFIINSSVIFHIFLF